MTSHIHHACHNVAVSLLMMLQINQMKLNFLTEQQKQSETSSLGDKYTSKAKADAEEKTGTKFVNFLTVPAETNRQERKSSQLQCMETVLTSESWEHEVDTSIRTLYAIVSSPGTEVLDSILRHPVSLSDTDSQS